MSDDSQALIANEKAAVSTRVQLYGLAAWLAVCLIAMAAGGILTNVSVDGWYASLERPSWSPPDWVFGPVWTTLFLMMAVSGWLVWRTSGLAGARWALLLFGLQLGLNVLWSCLFFALQSPGVAFVEIILLWMAILATIIAVGRHSPVAGLLLIPYLAWVTFAATLNFAFWRLNAASM